ncbi:MAG: MBL fold metallo-hydrolase [Gammaproteobacteria bacterium]|nr:MBL fold metallo-hydrolase [Gammaproteobacteria bacterium]NIN62126.1 MBL fold metallo-hydrolase [Gammaproteobacteria bacterium]NIO63620.1 MBL fold metallo-hydrolase [Gammaproteobacteria bacterium]NIP48994.1 MBL fold metallo-hydrolase [Gammaproteobacteria bacterium]NIQ09450.1 MBL fold metallo-hydrolase [Gammaproteobacteria bacterium]
MKIRFLGAAETVTGSRFLVESEEKRILIDCGLFQGLKKLRLRNWAQFPVDPSSIDAVVLTHAHIDHSGYLPALVKQGFKGRIYCTPATDALCRILLPDSGYLQEEEANNANKYGYSKHKPALPLYTRDDAENCLEYFETVSSEREFHPASGFRIIFRPVGHILGAASVYLTFNDKTVLFTGDIGRPNDPVMRPPADIEETDYLVVESTYGDRKHPRTSPKNVLERAVNYTIKRGGVVLIPSFAVGRAQTIMHLISELSQEGKLPNIPVYLDSPMAIDATEIFCYFRDQHRLSEDQCRMMCDRITYTRSVEESKAIASHLSPKIIISASGMLTGGRVVHHLKHYLGRRENVIVFAGYQAAGTRGAAMQAGAESVKIHGEYYPVRAKLVTIDALSAHADYSEMINWLSHLKRPPRKTFIVHGEPHSQDAFRRHIKDSLGWQATIPEQGDTVKLD